MASVEKCFYDINTMQMVVNETPTTAAWQQAVTQTAATMDVAPYQPRLQDAMDLVLAGAVDDAPGAAVVTSGTHRYAIDADRGCTCADAQHRSRWCKHAVALELYRRAWMRLHEETPREESPAMTTRPEPTPAPPTVPDATAFAESTLCIKVRLGHAELAWTLCGTDEDVAKRVQRQLAFLDRLAEERGARPADEPPPPAGPKPCPEHGTAKLKASKFKGHYCAARTAEGAFCAYTTEY